MTGPWTCKARLPTSLEVDSASSGDTISVHCSLGGPWILWGRKGDSLAAALTLHREVWWLFDLLRLANLMFLFDQSLIGRLFFCFFFVERLFFWFVLCRFLNCNFPTKRLGWLPYQVYCSVVNIACTYCNRQWFATDIRIEIEQGELPWNRPLLDEAEGPVTPWNDCHSICPVRQTDPAWCVLPIVATLSDTSRGSFPPPCRGSSVWVPEEESAFTLSAGKREHEWSQQSRWRKHSYCLHQQLF
jgi:hypothetical protein